MTYKKQKPRLDMGTENMVSIYQITLYTRDVILDDTDFGTGNYDKDFGESAGGLNSIGSIASDTTDLERIFTKEGKCCGCSSPIKIEASDKRIKIGRCTNKECDKIFTNVVPTAKGFKIIDELIEFKPIPPWKMRV